MNEIEILKIRISQLEKENEYLRTLLTNAGISFESEDKSTNADLEKRTVRQLLWVQQLPGV